MQNDSPLTILERKELHEFAENVANHTRSLILDLWLDRDINTRLKDDLTPVTDVDLRAEQIARKLITKRYPEHGVIGEEYDCLNPDSEYQWTIDPIDGTQNLVNRIPTFGTLIGLRFKNQAIIGVIDHPALNLRCSGGSGLGVRINGRDTRIEDLTRETFSANDIVASNTIGVFGRDPDGEALFHRVMSVHPHTRIYYDCYAHTLAVAGSLAVVVEPNLKIWDLTPVEALVTEAGGRFQYFNGRKYTGSSTLFNAVFGKSRAVAIMVQHLLK